MAKTDTWHIRIETSVKQKAEKTLNDLWLWITDEINVFLNQVILHDRIPFEIRKPRVNKATIEDTKKGENSSKTFNNADEMFEELDK